MTVLDWNTVTIMSTIFVVGATSALWLASQFSGIRKIIYSEMAKHSKEDDKRFREIGLQIQRVEIAQFGHTPLMKLPTNGS